MPYRTNVIGLVTPYYTTLWVSYDDIIIVAPRLEEANIVHDSIVNNSSFNKLARSKHLYNVMRLIDAVEEVEDEYDIYDDF